jgi:hypothetical protein
LIKDGPQYISVSIPLKVVLTFFTLLLHYDCDFIFLLTVKVDTASQTIVMDGEEHTVSPCH